MKPRRQLVGWFLALSSIVLAACGGALEVPASSLEELDRGTRSCPVQDVDPPSGTIVAGHPDEPASWLPAMFGDVASADFSALWGLPLYRYDAVGQLIPGLVRDTVVLGGGGGGWQVRLILCAGSWSDGQPVVAADVAATVAALRSTPAGPMLTSILDVRADGPDVVVTFDQASGRWQHVLADVGSVLPAHVLDDAGIEAYQDGVPVSGGPFRLVAIEDGLRRVFAAHVGSPLGAPRVERLEVLVVPRFELALGLVEEGELDVALGHLALETEARVELLDGVEGTAASGGTLVTWRWQAGAVIEEADQRTVLHRSFNLAPFAEALLDGGQGRVTRSFVDGQDGPVKPDRVRVDELPEVTVASPRWHESTGLVARAVRDGFERLGGTMRTAGEEADFLARHSLGDAHVEVRRLGPWPSLEALAVGALGPGDHPHLVDADRSSSAGSSSVAEGLVALEALAVEVPLAQVPVAHVWREGVTGVIPSSYPGIGFTSAAQWTSAG